MIGKTSPLYLHFLIAIFIAILMMPIAFAVSGPPTFLPVVTYSPAGEYPVSVTLADLNGDRNLDIVVASGFGGSNGNGLLNVFIGNGDGTFQAPVNYDSGAGWPTAVKTADLNGDAFPDVIVANCGVPSATVQCPSGPGFVAVLLGNGNGSLRSPMVYPSGGMQALSLSIADVNRDGMDDIVVANGCGLDGCQRSAGGVAILFGNKDGPLHPPVNVYSGTVIQASLADVNADGKTDLIVLAGASRIEVLLGNGNGAFGSSNHYLAPGIMSAFSMEVADLNNDSKLDIAVAGLDQRTEKRLGILLGNRDGTFMAGANYSLGGLGFGMTVADLNGDGAPDIAMGGCPLGVNNPCASADGIVTVLSGNGLGGFGKIVSSDSGGAYPVSLATGDLNGDGKPDFVVANFFGNNVGVLLNNTVPFGYATSISLTSSLNPSTYGQKITLTARVTATGSVPPTGTVVFKWKYFTTTYTIGTATLNSAGVATLTKSNLNANSFPMIAVYRGDANNVSSTSAVLNQTVLQTTSAAAITSSANPSAIGQAVTFTAKITSPTVIPSGPVTFKAGTTVLGTAQLSGGRAILTTSSLPVGSTRVTVSYAGNSNIAKSSASVTQVVQP